MSVILLSLRPAHGMGLECRSGLWVALPSLLWGPLASRGVVSPRCPPCMVLIYSVAVDGAMVLVCTCASDKNAHCSLMNDLLIR